MMINETPQVLTIAGSDSGGGAGVQADLKTFQARKVFGMTIFVALTAQNTMGVQASLPIPCDFIAAQFQSLAEDFKIKAVKTGMLADAKHVSEVIKQLKKFDFGPLIVDPVMIAKGGHKLLADDAIVLIKEKLLPITSVVTPNIPEAEILLGYPITTREDMIKAAADLRKLGVQHVIIKGGHGQGKISADFVWLADGERFWLEAPRINTENTHGTGDTFSACIAAEIAKGQTISKSIITAKKFIQGAISQPISVGHGHGPTNHWASLNQDIIVKDFHK
ncbi:bifunctional hydroxymethylpyrimidine kinase/phosphomethylpyrimidine kinase [Vagococcus vulneris]|uniref:Hydroxymethylpyrimidine/phosphomethylpyrimidine kinase n=1 Tax=Vagococcus vulneris TaxID=1977869 RepID=A0A429ZZ18_9ENTE|nr:bifunctional hydroxymethylpyrimidine kinase/phosphomethylpyrimidine kinase [Vagococcus vulneris]RST99267.1 bifunctional hydroxymethylpyrimidine kinase/phosphomethylpyrimidine kinase [Vagococcus vulneris]